MANTLANTSLVTRRLLARTENALNMALKVDRQSSKDFSKVGDTINIRKPIYFTTTSSSTFSAQDIIEGKTAVQLDQRKHVGFEFTQQELQLNIEEADERYIKPAALQLAQEIETSIANTYTDIANWVGTPGTTPSTFLDVNAAKTMLMKLGVPRDKPWSAFYNEDASGALANGLRGVFPEKIANRAIEQAEIGRYSGFDMFENQSLVNHTTGAFTTGSTPLVNGASQNITYTTGKDSYTQSLITDGWANSTAVILAGDIFTIAGVFSINHRTKQATADLQTFVATADGSSDGSGDLTVTISPQIITSGAYQTVSAAPADNAVITMKGTESTAFPQNLAWHPNAITLAFAPLAGPFNTTSSTQSMNNLVMTSTFDGDFDAFKSKYRFDVLYAVVVQNPYFAVRTTG